MQPMGMHFTDELHTKIPRWEIPGWERVIKVYPNMKV